MLKSLAPFLRHLRGRSGSLLALFLLGLAGSAASLSTPLVGKTFIDAVAGRGDFSMVPTIAVALVALAVVDVGIGFLSRFLHARLSADVLVSLRERLFRHCIHAPIEGVEKFRHGDLLSRFGADVPRIQSLLVDGAIGCLHNLLFLSVAAVILITLSTQLALWSFLGLGVALVITMVFRGPVERGTQQIRERMADLSHFFAERLSALRSIRLHGAQPEDEASLASLNRELVNRVVRFQMIESGATHAPGLVLSLSLAWIYLLGGRLLESGEISLGTFVAFVLYQGRLYGPATGLLGLVRTLQEVRVSLDRVTEVLAGEENTDRLPRSAGIQTGWVSLDNVTFAYTPAAPVLQGVTLEIPPGEKVALFGASGAGKSTLVQMLFGLRRPQEGQVLIEGRSLASDGTTHDVMGYACAEPFLLHATVEENLRYGNPDATTDELVEAARLAEAHAFILSLPQGFSTVIGGRGLSLSDGQRQRLGLARLILKKPHIMILDEAFSALDPETERRVRHNLWSAFPGRTALIITHRLDDLEQYDRLLLLDRGQLTPVSPEGLRHYYSETAQNLPHPPPHPTTTDRVAAGN